MAVTTKSNSDKVVEVIKLALKFIYYFHIYFFFLARLKVLEEKKKKVISDGSGNDFTLNM